MPGTLFKVWSLTEKKMVFAASMQQFITSGRQKLGLKDEDIFLYLQDCTEIDDEILQALEPQTIIYLLHKDDEKPWEQAVRVIPVEEFDYNVFRNETKVSMATSEQLDSHTEAGNVSFDITPHLQQPWPQKFQLPVTFFSEELTESLSVGNLQWRAKNELLGHVSREILKYTSKPSAGQRDQVAKELIALFPNMKSKIGEGHHGWAQKIYDKMNDEAKRRGSSKRPSDAEGLKCVKLPRRGEVNFCPNVVVPPEVSSASKKFLAEEVLKPPVERDQKAVAEHMSITFSDRRLLISQKSLVRDLKGDYPMLFSEQGISLDFLLLNSFELEPRFFERLQLCAEKIRDEAVLVKKKFSDVQGILKENTNSSITALRLLPYLLGDKDSSYLYKCYPFETDISVVRTCGPQTPHVVALGEIDENCLCFIVVNKMMLFQYMGFLKHLC